MAEMNEETQNTIDFLIEYGAICKKYEVILSCYYDRLKWEHYMQAHDLKNIHIPKERIDEMIEKHLKSILEIKPQ